MKYNLSKVNFILIVISLFFIVLGFFLMAGDPSTSEAYNPDIFSTRRITIGPMISLFGFISVVIAILWKPKKK